MGLYALFYNKKSGVSEKDTPFDVFLLSVVAVSSSIVALLAVTVLVLIISVAVLILIILVACLIVVISVLLAHNISPFRPHTGKS